MFRNLNTGAIGIRSTLSEALEMAQTHDFDGVDFSIAEIASLAGASSLDAVKQLFSRTGRRPGTWGLPVDFRGEEQKWKEDLDALRSHAAVANAIGAHRTATYVIPFSNDLSFDENYAFHVNRLKPVVTVLHEYGIRLGLEFIGPKTLRADKKYEFIHTMDGMFALCADLGSNTGLLLDLYHWYTSHGTQADLDILTNQQVVAVHVNDAPSGIPVDEQMDLVRCLPCETGVMDISGFLKALHRIGYDGPVTVEPFSKRLNAMAPSDALKETGLSLKKAWAAMG